MRTMRYYPDPSITEHNGIKIGDMVTTYHKGYHKVIGFQYYNNTKGAAMQCLYQRVVDSKGNPYKNGKVESCHASYVRKVDYNSLADDHEFEKEELRLKYCVLFGVQKELETEQNVKS